MLTIITDEKIIRRTQERLVKALLSQSAERMRVSLGHQGATVKAWVYYLSSLDLWFTSRKLADGRFWNAFGCGRPDKEKLKPIVCEINFPPQGIDRRTGGVLAADDQGDIYLLHRGRIGGGKRGVGQTLFRERYQGVWTWLREGKSTSPALVIGRIKSVLLARQVARFVFNVARLKTEISGQAQMALIFEDAGFHPDRLGSLLHKQETAFGYECDRQLVVIDLAGQLQSCGYRVGNNPQRDVFIWSETGKISAVFEIITDISERALLAGVARLLWNNTIGSDNPQRFLVLPKAPVGPAAEKLDLLHIRILTYHWQEGYAVFDLAGFKQPPC